METTIAERFRLQDLSLSREIEDLLLECEIAAAEPVMAPLWTGVERSPLEPSDPEHWQLFLDQACNRGVDVGGDVVDRSAWLYEDCYLSDEQTRSGYWWQDREAVPALDVRFNT